MANRTDELRTQSRLLYESIAFMFSMAFSIFFRQIQIRGSYKIPKHGAVLFVAAPHANQFVDPMVVIVKILEAANRHVSFLIAEKSYKHPIIGGLAHRMLAIPVGRSQDTLKKATGVISGDENDQCVVIGDGTKFLSDVPTRGYLAVQGSADMAEVKEVISDTKLILARPFESAKARSTLVKGSTPFKAAVRIDNSEMFQNVFTALADNHCVGIFPEGGSHDRTEMLPLKPGVAIMALGTLAQHPESNLTIVPLGLNYFHPHKFRSRVVIEFGDPLEINKEYVDQYRDGDGQEKRAATQKLMADILDALESVTISCPDYETLMLVQAGQRLYRPSRKLPLSLVIEFTRRFIQAYAKFKDEPRVQQLKTEVLLYNSRLHTLGLKDHQVQNARPLPKYTLLGRLVWRFFYAITLWILCIPGTIIFAPIVVASKHVSHKKAAAALKASSVKIKAHDVIGTWKILVALGLTPLMFTMYSIISGWFAFRANGGIIEYSLLRFLLFWIVTGCFQGILCYATLIIGEAGMDTFRTLRPLALALSPKHKDTFEALRMQRQELVYEVTELVNELGPQMFPDITERMERHSTKMKDFRHDRRMDLRSLQSAMAPDGDYNIGDIPVFSTISASEGPSRVSFGSGTNKLEDEINASATGVELNHELSRRIKEMQQD